MSINSPTVKYLDVAQVKQLSRYLEALHERGDMASPQHTMLLLNCYTNMKDKEKIDSFMQNRHTQYTFDVNIAISVLRRAGYLREAAELAKDDGQHRLFLELILDESHAQAMAAAASSAAGAPDVGEQRKSPAYIALQYMHGLPHALAEKYFHVHGFKLMRDEPHEAMSLVKQLCADWGHVSDDAQPYHSLPEDFLHFFVGHPDQLTEFLEAMIANEDIPAVSPPVYDSLLEIYMREYSQTLHMRNANRRQLLAKRIRRHLQNPEATYDRHHALALCKQHGFGEGRVYLLRELQLYMELMTFYAENDDWHRMMEVAEEHGNPPEAQDVQVQSRVGLDDDSDPENAPREARVSVLAQNKANPRLWLQAVRELKFVHVDHASPAVAAMLRRSLERVLELNLLSLPELLEELKGTGQPLHLMRPLIEASIKRDRVAAEESERSRLALASETERLKGEIERFETEPITFSSMRKGFCDLQSCDDNCFYLPAVHFFCQQHVFHESCVKDLLHDVPPGHYAKCPECVRQELGPGGVPQPDQLRLEQERIAQVEVDDVFGSAMHVFEMDLDDADEYDPNATGVGRWRGEMTWRHGAGTEPHAPKDGFRERPGGAASGGSSGLGRMGALGGRSGRAAGLPGRKRWDKMKQSVILGYKS